jgi:anti-anti-sigma regulatory factor
MQHETFAAGSVVLTGDATLQYADAIHASLLARASDPLMKIDCSGVTKADLTLVQSILAARLSAQRSGRSVMLAQPATGALLDTLRRGGFLTVSESQSDPQQAFWLQTTDMQ